MELVLTGDVNIDILKHRKRHTSDYLTMMVENGLIPCINKATRVFKGATTCRNHFFVSHYGKGDIAEAVILLTAITDHYPILVALNNKKMNQKIRTD